MLAILDDFSPDGDQISGVSQTFLLAPVNRLDILHASLNEEVKFFALLDTGNGIIAKGVNLVQGRRLAEPGIEQDMLSGDVCGLCFLQQFENDLRGLVLCQFLLLASICFLSSRFPHFRRRNSPSSSWENPHF